VKALKARGTEFLQVPKSYYKTLRDNLQHSKVKIAEDLDKIEVIHFLSSLMKLTKTNASLIAPL